MRKEDHLIAVGLGIEFCLIMLAGTYAGYLLDKKFEAMPLFLLLGVSISFALGLYILIKTALSLGKRLDEQKKEAKK